MALRKSTLSLGVALLVLVATGADGASVPRAGQLENTNREEVRRQLSAYFSDIATNSPTVLGKLAKSPEAMKEVQQRIASMSDEELAHFQKLMAEMPDWKIAPEAFAKAVPPEMLQQIQRVSGDYADQLPEGKEMREDVNTLVTVLKQLPDEKLKELGIDRQFLKSLEQTFTEMTPLQASMLHRRIGEASPWDARSAAALTALPPALQRGAAALAAHGPLTENDLAALEKFRGDVTSLFQRIDRLPPETRKSLKAGPLAEDVKQLGLAPPDVLFMMRHNLTPEIVGKLEKNVAFLERLANLSTEDKEKLEVFRGELADVFAAAEGDEAQQAEVEEMLAELGPEHLMALQKRMASLGPWQTSLPVFYQTLGSPDLAARLEAVTGPSPDPAAIQTLEAFRLQAYSYIDAAAVRPGVNVEQVERLRQAVMKAPTDRLEILRMAVEKMPKDSSTEALLSIASMTVDLDFNCSVDLGCIDLVVDEWCLSFSLNFICDPIETAIETVANGILSVVDTVVDAAKSALQTTINTVKGALETAINAVEGVVNDIIDGITSTADAIWDFLQDLPHQAWLAIQAAFDLLLDIEIANGVTVRDLVASGIETALHSIQTLIGISGNWWQAISNFTLPLIPCPPDGFHTPWGVVGSTEAAVNYGRYKLLIDGIIDMIPDTEISLSIKIPAQLLYMTYDFMGLCLDQASAASDDTLAGTRHTLVLDNFANLQTYFTQQITGFSSATTGQNNALFEHVTTQSNTIQLLLNNQSSAIQTLINDQSTSIQNLINAESTEIQNTMNDESTDIQNGLEEFRMLNLKLIIERVLNDGNGRELAHLILPEPLGHLGLVRDVVREMIGAMSVAQLGVGNAQTSYDKGVQFMNSGKYKDAFKEFAKAYRDVAK